MSDRETEILQALAGRPSADDERRLVEELSFIRTQRSASLAEERSLDFATEVVAAHLTPVQAFERHSDATSWLADATNEVEADLTQIVQSMRTEASLWWANLHEAVKADPEEIAVQSVGQARRYAGQYGDRYDDAIKAYVDHVAFLRHREAATNQGEGDQNGYARSDLPDGVKNEDVAFPIEDGSTTQPAKVDLKENPPSLSGGSSPEGDTAPQLVNPEAPKTHDAHGGDGTNTLTNPDNTPSDADVQWKQSKVAETDHSQHAHDGDGRCIGFGADGHIRDLGGWLPGKGPNKTSSLRKTASEYEVGEVDGEQDAEQGLPPDPSRHHPDPRGGYISGYNSGYNSKKTSTLRTARALHQIADEISREWGRTGGVHYTAKPYLDAMRYLSTTNDRFGEDTGKSVVAYFLSNASQFKGEKAKALKAELKDHLAGKATASLAYQAAPTYIEVEGVRYVKADITAGDPPQEGGPTADTCTCGHLRLVHAGGSGACSTCSCDGFKTFRQGSVTAGDKPPWFDKSQSQDEKKDGDKPGSGDEDDPMGKGAHPASDSGSGEDDSGGKDEKADHSSNSSPAEDTSAKDQSTEQGSKPDKDSQSDSNKSYNCTCDKGGSCTCKSASLNSLLGSPVTAQFRARVQANLGRV